MSHTNKMGNGSLTFRIVNLKIYNYKTTQPWDETKDFVIAETFGTYCLYEDPTALPKDCPQPACLDTGKTELSFIRDMYHVVARETRYKNWITWWWNFQDKITYLSPKEADVMSLYWNDLWTTLIKRVEEEYPIHTDAVRRIAKEMGDIIAYAAIKGLTVRIDHNNGY